MKLESGINEDFGSCCSVRSGTATLLSCNIAGIAGLLVSNQYDRVMQA